MYFFDHDDEDDTTSFYLLTVSNVILDCASNRNNKKKRSPTTTATALLIITSPVPSITEHNTDHKNPVSVLASNDSASTTISNDRMNKYQTYSKPTLFKLSNLLLLATIPTLMEYLHIPAMNI